MRVVIVDTDVASFIFKGDTRGALYDPHIDVTSTLPAISFMTRAELEQWAVMRNWGQTKRDELRAFIEDGFVTVDSNEALCTMWAEVRGQAQRAGDTSRRPTRGLPRRRFYTTRSWSHTTPETSTFCQGLRSSRRLECQRSKILPRRQQSKIFAGLRPV
jgi:predicted nucleic acid-binding protein